MVNVAVACGPVCGEYRTKAPPPPFVPSQLFGPKKNRAAAGTSGRPLPVGEQCLIVTWTTEPTGPESGHTVIDESGISAPGLLAQEGAGAAADDMAGADGLTAGAEADGVTGVVVEGAVVGDVAGTGADGAVAADAAAGAAGAVLKADEDRAATGVLDWQAASAVVAAQAMTAMAADRAAGIASSP